MKLKNFLHVCSHSKAVIMVFLGLFLGLYGFNQFWSGYHDLDMAQNLIFLRDDIQLELWENSIPFTLGQYTETTTDGYGITQEHLYYNGVLRLKKSIPMVIVGFIMFGFYLREMHRDEI